MKPKLKRKVFKGWMRINEDVMIRKNGITTIAFENRFNHSKDVPVKITVEWKQK